MFLKSCTEARHCVGFLRFILGHFSLSRHYSPHHGSLHRARFLLSPSPFRGQYHTHDSPSVTDVAVACQRFRSHVHDRNINGIHKSYALLVDNLNNSLQGGVDIGKDVVIEALGILAASGRPQDYTLMDKIVDGMPTRLGLEIDSRVHNSIFQSLLARGKVQTAYNWLSQMGSKPGACSATLEQWHDLIAGCGAQRNIKLAWSTIQTMRRLGCPSTPSTFRLLFQELFKSGFNPRMHILKITIDIMKEEGLPYDPALLQLLVKFYTDAEHSGLGMEAEHIYRRAFGMSTESQISDMERDRRLAATAKGEGKWAAIRLYNQYKAQGFRASQDTLLAVLFEVTDLSVLQYWEKILDIQADSPAFAKLIRNAAWKSQTMRAIHLYKSALALGVRPTNAMLHPILRSLCATPLRPPNDAAIDCALELYEEFVHFSTIRENSTGSDEARSQSHSNLTRPDAPIYNTLLRALCSSNNTTKYHPRAVALLEDMHSRGVRMDNMTSTSLVVLLIRCSSDFAEAFKVYRLVCRAPDGASALDGEGYIAVLNAFCKLSPDPTSIPPPSLYFEIVQDMRVAGHTMTPKVYTILLQQLAILATRLSPDDISALDQLVKSIRRAHHFLSVDASVTPDTVLWNQLMDTYQRAGCFAEAFQVWETLYRSGQHDNASVSIILDVCAYTKAYGKAWQIWARLNDDRFCLNQQNWKNWIECLCRMDVIHEALKEMCLEMGKGRDDIEPDEETARILLRFASHTNQELEVRLRLKRYLPDLWMKLQDDFRSNR
ncbi:hypothetical protein AcW1_000940 [Taiwanofungus camphoratus]|nr:hypothetical protein AcW1_000940 [Antrodia cinnamomea]